MTGHISEWQLAYRSRGVCPVLCSENLENTWVWLPHRGSIVQNRCAKCTGVRRCSYVAGMWCVRNTLREPLRNIFASDGQICR